MVVVEKQSALIACQSFQNQFETLPKKLTRRSAEAANGPHGLGYGDDQSRSLVAGEVEACGCHRDELNFSALAKLASRRMGF